MPRAGRDKSETGIYHIVLRGINQQAIFEDDEDCKKMIHALYEVKQISGYTLYAYCIMKNHFHLLLKEGQEGLEHIFKRFGPRYVYWYNAKYKREGYLFQGRFWSEPIKNERHLFAVLRYIHQNPLAAGLCVDLIDYRWSSYREYVVKSSFVDVEFIFSLLTIENFIELHKKLRDYNHLDNYSSKYRLTDVEARNIISQISNCNNVSEFQKLSSPYQRQYIKKMRSNGVSIRQISRLTGVSKGVVERI